MKGAIVAVFSCVVVCVLVVKIYKLGANNEALKISNLALQKQIELNEQRQKIEQQAKQDIEKIKKTFSMEGVEKEKIKPLFYKAPVVFLNKMYDYNQDEKII